MVRNCSFVIGFFRSELLRPGLCRDYSNQGVVVATQGLENSVMFQISSWNFAMFQGIVAVLVWNFVVVQVGWSLSDLSHCQCHCLAEKPSGLVLQPSLLKTQVSMVWSCPVIPSSMCNTNLMDLKSIFDGVTLLNKCLQETFVNC